MPMIFGRTSTGLMVPVQVDANGIVVVSGSLTLGAALPAGNNNIGDVDVASIAAGDNNIGNVDIVTLPALPAGTNEIGMVQARNYGWYSAAWQKSPVRFGFSGDVQQAISSTALAAGSNTLNGAAVPAGRVWVITSAALSYSGTVAGVTIAFQLVVSAVAYYQFMQTGLTSAVFYDRQGWWVIPPGGNIRVSITGATLNDDSFNHFTGFYVDLNQ